MIFRTVDNFYTIFEGQHLKFCNIGNTMYQVEQNIFLNTQNFWLILWKSRCLENMSRISSNLMLSDSCTLNTLTISTKPNDWSLLGPWTNLALIGYKRNYPKSTYISNVFQCNVLWVWRFLTKDSFFLLLLIFTSFFLSSIASLP